MSSTVTTSIQQQLPKPEEPIFLNRGKKRQQPPTKLDEKRDRFTRTSSIERLKRFNTFICSQHYFILPALLYWLKSSKTVLQSTLETCIQFAKNLLFHYFNSRRMFGFYNIRHADLLPALKMLISVKYDSWNIVYKSTKRTLFALCVYTTMLAIFFQLMLCFYFLSKVFLPGGFLFLCSCIYIISHINFNVLIHMSHKEIKVQQRQTSRKDLYLTSERTARSRSIIKPKQILGNRTISNVNFF